MIVKMSRGTKGGDRKEMGKRPSRRIFGILHNDLGGLSTFMFDSSLHGSKLCSFSF